MNLSKRRIPFQPSSLSVVKCMVELASPQPGDKIIDLGAGDGRIPIYFALKYDDIHCYGIEISSDLVDLAQKRVGKLDLSNRVKILKGDLFKVNLSKFDIITMYLTPYAIKRLLPSLITALSTGSKIISHDFKIPGLSPVKQIVVDSRHKLYLYSSDSIPRNFDNLENSSSLLLKYSRSL